MDLGAWLWRRGCGWTWWGGGVTGWVLGVLTPRCHCVCVCVPPQDAEGNPVDVSVKDNGNGTYSCSYVPKKPLKHTAMVSWGGVNIPQSPFRVRGGDGGVPKTQGAGPNRPGRRQA